MFTLFNLIELKKGKHNSKSSASSQIKGQAVHNPVSLLFCICMSSSIVETAKPMHKLREGVDRAPSNLWIHADEIIQVHFGISSFNTRIGWRSLSPVPAGIFHVRSVRGKILQIQICSDHSKFPSKLWMDVLVRFKGIFHIHVKGAGKRQDSVKIIDEALSST